MDRRWVIQREGKDFVLYAGLLDLAHERGLVSIETTLIQLPTETNGNCAVVQATVRLSDSQGVVRSFSGIGDTAPSNVNRMMAPHLIRMAETRAKARALRDAVNVGEALADDPSDEAAEPPPAQRTEARQAPGTHQSRPGKDAPPREWFAYLAALARARGIPVPPTPGPGVSDEAVVAENRRLRGLIEAAQQAAGGAR
jgi:hypothetical protein